MRIDIISAIPELMQSYLQYSIIKNAIDKQFAEIYLHNLHDYTENKHNRIDDYIYGGEAGMLLSPQPLSDCILQLKKERHYDEIIFMSADGVRFNQKSANFLSQKENLIIIAGRYKGIDQRIRDKYITQEISIGDYVLTGGELPALVITDTIIRLLPGVIGDCQAALNDSFQDGLLEAPQYTRPEEYLGMKVPDILLSGNHKKIEDWKIEQSLKKTKSRRPDLLDE